MIAGGASWAPRRWSLPAVLVDAAKQRRHESDETSVFVLRLAWHEQVGAGVGVQSPVVVLAVAVYSRERLFVEQRHEGVLEGQIAEHIHGQHIRVGGQVGEIEDRGNLVLRRRDLVVGAVDRNAEFPHPLPGFGHIGVHAGRQLREVVAGLFLAAQRRRAQQCSTGGDQVRPGEVPFPVHQEELLLPADVADDFRHLGFTQKVQESDALLVDGQIGPQQGGLLIQGFAVPGHERRRDVERLPVHERRRVGVPTDIGCCLVGLAKSAVRERRTVRFGLEQISPRKIDDQPVRLEVDTDEGLELFTVNRPAHRREPMRIPNAAPRMRPFPDRFGKLVLGVPIHRQAGRPATGERVVHVRVDQFLQDGIVEDVAVDVR